MTMSHQGECRNFEEQVLHAYDKLHNQLDNNTTEDVALDLLSSLPSPSTFKDKDKFTLLHYACYNGWYRVTKELIKKLCDPNAENANGSTPLYFACKSGNLELVKYLILKENCDPNKPNTLGLVPLHNAALGGHISIVNYLIEEKQCSTTPRDNNGITPLHLACQSGNLEMVKYLIHQKNCDPKKSNKKGLVPLHNAALGGHTSIVNYLVEEKECSSTTRDIKGITPLHLACQSGSLPVVKYFIETQKCSPVCVTNDRFTQPLHLACQNGHLEIAKYLIEEKYCNPVSVNGEGFQTVHLACKSGNLDMIKYLIENQSCKPDCINKLMRWTPLHLACESGSLIAANYLIVDKKCDPMYKGNDGVTPLYLACRNGHLDLVKYLTEEQKCDPNCRIKNGCTPLHSACQNGHLDVAKYLIEVQRIHPTCTSNSHWTPLHLACVSGHIDIVKYLIHERHCDPDSKTFHGHTPLSLAYKYHHFSIIVYLVKDCMCNVPDSKIVLTDNIVKNHPEITLFLIASSKLLYEQTSFKVKSGINAMFHPTSKVFVFGHELVGKSTFIKAIESHTQNVPHKQSTEQDFFSQDSRLPQSTGIIPVHIKNYCLEHHFIMYDFAGRSGYHACHAAFLENVTMTQGCLIVIIIDLTKSTQKCVLELQYWKSFIDNLFISQCSQSQRLKLIIVSSHADVVKSNGENPDHKTEQIIRAALGVQGGNHSKIVTDCRMKTSDGLKTISNRISTLCNEYRKGLNNIKVQVHFLKYLLQKYPMNNKLVCQFTDIKDFVFSKENTALKTNGLIPTDIEHLSDDLATLSDNSELLYLKNSEDINASWIIFNVSLLFTSMNTALFSQRAILHYSSETGVVSLSEIKKLLPNDDPKLITGLMLHLGICCEIDQSVLRLIIKNDSHISGQEKYFFFPHLVNTDLPSDNVVKFSQFRCGWHCRQTNDREISTTRFAQTVIIQLMTKFISLKCEQAIPAQRMCTVWKTGIQWQNSSGIQAFVKFVEQHFTVMVEVGSQAENGTECLLYRSKIIKMILYIKNKVLGTVEIQGTYIDPEQYSQQGSEYESLDRKG